MSSDGVEQTPPDLLDEGQSNNNDDDDAMFSSAMSPATLDIPLGGNEDEENDDDNPFGGPLTTQPIREKTPTNTTNVIEVTPPAQSAPSTDEMDEDPFGTTTKPAVSEPVAYPVLAKPVETPPPPASIQTQVSTPSTPPVVPKTLSEPPKTKPVETKQTRVERKIEVTVSDPSKVGEGMSSYMTYRISTRTTLPIFKKPEFSVNRRFSDFLGLHGKLIQKYLHQGLLLPHPPEKDSLSMAKVKISKDEGMPTDFIDRRRALLERYLNRLVQQEKVLEDSDVREFLENPSDLPKATNTQALSGAGFLRAFSTISNQVTKLTTKTSEQDQWFEEKYAFVIELQNHFKRLYEQMNSLFNHRRESAQALKQFSASLNHLAHVEEHALLSSVLVELANLEEKLDQLTNEYALKEYSTLSELAKEYVGLLEMVQLSFNERIKAHQQWLNAEDTLKKKRETKAKLEQSPKNADKLPQAEKEIHDWEGKVVSGKEDFERISTTIRHELDVFEETRIDDFKNAIDHYLKNLLEEQERALQLWESFLPEASKIAV